MGSYPRAGHLTTRMPWTNPNPSPQCPSCSRPVFPAEAYMASDRRPFHKQCVKCNTCSKKLAPANINEHGGKLFCMLCYANNFMPQDDLIPARMAMQVLPVGGLYNAIEEEKRRAQEELLRQEMEERARNSGGCPACGNKAEGDDATDVSGVRYHKPCLRCAACGNKADESMTMLLGPREADNVFGKEQLDPYCKYCFAKKFSVGCINIAETVNIVKGL